MKPHAVKGYAMILLSAIGFGSYGLWSRLMGQEFSPLYQSWARSALVLVGLIPIAIITKSFTPIKKEDIKWLLAPVLFGSLCNPASYYAFNHMHIGTAIFIIYAFFLITLYLAGKVFFNETITLYKLISLFLSCVGLFYIFGFSFQELSLLAVGAAALNGVASGLTFSTTKKSTHKFNSIEIAVYVWIGTLLTNLPLSLLLRERQLTPNLSLPWIAMYMFALCGLLCLWLVVEGFRYVDSSIGGLIGLLEIVVSALLGLVIFHEHLTSSVIFGGALILISAMLPDVAAIFSKSRLQTPTKTDTPVVK